MEKIVVLMLCYIRFHRSTRISMRNPRMMDGYIFSSIMPTFFTGTSPLRMSVPLRKHMWATVDRCYVPLSFQFQFALKLFSSSGSVNETLAFTKKFVALTYMTPRNASEMIFFIANNVSIFHTSPSIYFTERKNCWLNAAMSGWVVDNQYRHCIRGSSVERPITFHVSIWNVICIFDWALCHFKIS